ncbi:hypothetical protein FRC19_009236 [Serendipita sp. 401]|nr:hypothetical protein FRC19_009236 [Serendipita sp. 401]
MSSKPILINPIEQTCRRFQHILKHSTLLQLIVELAVQGLRLRTHIGLNDDYGSPIDILNTFRRSQDAWKKIEPFKTTTIPFSTVEYDIYNRLFAYELVSDRSDFRGIVSNNHKLDCETEPLSVSIWKRTKDIGIDVLDYSYDIASDLLVIVEKISNNVMKSQNRVFLLTISDGGLHPQANTTCLSFKRLPSRFHIKIVNDYLAICSSQIHNFDNACNETLTIWNWKTGIMCYERAGIIGYAFLSPDTIALVVSIRKNLLTMDAGIELIHLRKQKADVFLALPDIPLPSDTIVLSDKPVVDSPTAIKHTPLSPFIIDETAERIIVIHSYSSNLFIACRPLLRILLDESIEPLSKKTSKSSYRRMFKWDQWGPENTFWLRMQPLSPGYVAVNGGRFCSLVETVHPVFITNKDIRNGDKERALSTENATEDGDEAVDSLVVGIRKTPMESYLQWGKSILILDFNPRPILHAASKKEEIDESVKHEEKSEGGRWSWFRKRTKVGKWAPESSKSNESKISGLPFRAYQKPMRSRYNNMVLYTDHILRVTAEASAYEVLQFIN